MQEGNLQGLIDHIRGLMHRVGAEDDHLGPRGFEGSGFLGEEHPGLLPGVATLKLDHRGEVERSQQAAGRMKTAHAIANALIDQPVVLRG